MPLALVFLKTALAIQDIYVLIQMLGLFVLFTRLSLSMPNTCS